MSGLDDLRKSAASATHRRSGDQRGGDLLGGLGGGGLGSILGQILGGGGTRSGSLAGGNPMLRMLLPVVASLLMNGGLQKLLARLRQSGNGSKAESWVSTGSNEPVDAADVREALDDQELERVAQQLGVSKEEAAEAVAQVLPDVVDQATPEGALPPEEKLNERLGRLHALETAPAG